MKLRNLTTENKLLKLQVENARLKLENENLRLYAASLGDDNLKLMATNIRMRTGIDLACVKIERMKRRFVK